MPKALKTSAPYNSLVLAIGVDDDNTTAKDFTGSRTLTLESSTSPAVAAGVASGPYGHGITVSSAAGDYAPRAILLNSDLTISNSGTSRWTLVMVFNDYTTTKDSGRYYGPQSGGSIEGYFLAGNGADREYPRLTHNSSSIEFTSAKSIKGVRSMVAISVDQNTSTQRVWVARDGETFPTAPEYTGSRSWTSLTNTLIRRIGGTHLGSQSSNIYAFLVFSGVALGQTELATIYNSLTGSGAGDWFEPPPAPTITTQPSNQTVTAPNAATFTFAFTGSGVTIQAQRQPAAGGGFSNVGSTFGTGSYTTGATTVSGGAFSSGDQFQFIISNPGGSVTTNAVTLTVNAPADTTPPTLTGSITVGTVTTSSIQISWPAGSDNVAVTSYEVSSNGGSSYTDVGNVLTHTFTGLAESTSYALRVRAKDAAGNVSTPALAVSQSTGSSSDTTPPTLSGSINIGSVTSTTIQMSWPAGSDNVAVTSYEVSSNAGASFVDVGNVLTHTFTGLTPSTSYALRVRAKDAAGNVSTPALSAVQSTGAGADTTPPTLTGSITVGTVTTSSIQVSWPAGSDNVAVNSYEVSSNGGTSYTDVGNVLTHTFSGLSPATSYPLRVRAKDAAGNVSTPALAVTQSTSSVSASVYTALTDVIAESGIPLAGTLVYFSWFPAGRPGAMPTPINGQVTTDAAGRATISHSVAGAGMVLIGTRPGPAVSNDRVFAQFLTLA